MSKVDPRVVRTRALLIDALMQLIVEKDYESITIREIVNQAKVNRSTFYLHFYDKKDIMTKLLENLLSDLKESMENPSYIYESALYDYKKFNKPIHSAVSMLEHIQQRSSLYQKLLNETEFRKSVIEIFEVVLLPYNYNNNWEAIFIANGSVGIIHSWLKTGMKETTTELGLLLTKIALLPLGKWE